MTTTTRPDAPTARLLATAAPATVPSEPADLITSTMRRNDLSPASRLKTLSYLDNVLARAEAREAGMDEALMLNTRGDVADHPERLGKSEPRKRLAGRRIEHPQVAPILQAVAVDELHRDVIDPGLRLPDVVDADDVRVRERARDEDLV